MFVVFEVENLPKSGQNVSKLSNNNIIWKSQKMLQKDGENTKRKKSKKK